MSDFPDIINTPVVPNNWNQLWDHNDALQNLTPKPVLILSLPYQSATAEEIQLQKMMDACKLTADKYNIIQIKENQLFNINTAIPGLKAEKILLFGISPFQLGISAQFVLNTPNPFAGCVFIPALSLSVMEQQPEMKKQLWNNALKPVFVESK